MVETGRDRRSDPTIGPIHFADLQVVDNCVLKTETFGRLFKKIIQVFSIRLASGFIPTEIEVAPQRLDNISTMQLLTSRVLPKDKMISLLVCTMVQHSAG